MPQWFGQINRGSGNDYTEYCTTNLLDQDVILPQLMVPIKKQEFSPTKTKPSQISDELDEFDRAITVPAST